MAPPILYTTLAVDKVNGRGLSNTVHREPPAEEDSRITRRHQLVRAFQL